MTSESVRCNDFAATSPLRLDGRGVGVRADAAYAAGAIFQTWPIVPTTPKTAT